MQPMCRRTISSSHAGSPAHPAPRTSPRVHARRGSAPPAAPPAAPCRASLPARTRRPLALRARPNKGDAASSASCGGSEARPRSPGLRPRWRRRLLGGAPAMRAWRQWRQQQRRRRLGRPPRGLRGARAAGARSAPAPWAQVPARAAAAAAAARAGGRRRAPAGPGPAPATPRRALLLASPGGTTAPALPGIRSGGGDVGRSVLGRFRSLRLRLGRARGVSGRSAAGAGTALSGAAGEAGVVLRVAGRRGRQRLLRLPGPSR